MKTGIALPGSKNAGAFAIGVLKALEELGIAPQMAAASGDAAFPAVLYASGCGMEELEPLYTYYRGYAQPQNRFSSLLDWIFRKNRLRKYLEDQMSGLKVRTVRQIQKPLALMMTDLISGREVLTAPLAESRSDELDVVPDLLLSEVLYACAKGVGRVEYRG
ncbi:MAG: hypothetical protein HFE85_02635, partial [Clostridiales bacterium]|nr:hypothetical protein [Clostridiales bacterium]